MNLHQTFALIFVAFLLLFLVLYGGRLISGNTFWLGVLAIGVISFFFYRKKQL